MYRPQEVDHCLAAAAADAGCLDINAYNPPLVSESVAQMKVRGPASAAAAAAAWLTTTPSSTSLLLLLLLQALAMPTWDDLVRS
jgi:hypothetical protein